MFLDVIYFDKRYFDFEVEFESLTNILVNILGFVFVIFILLLSRSASLYVTAARLFIVN